MKKILLTLLAPLCLLANDNDMGIEINPFRLLLHDEDMSSFSGAFSYFLEEENAEIRFPIFWMTNTNVDYSYPCGVLTDGHFNETQATIDVEYRYFINGESVDGLFVGAVARYAYLSNERTDRSTNKFGLGIAVGYRYMPEGSNWYWGTSVTVVRFVSGENSILEGGGIDMRWVENDDSAAVDFNFLKIGYRF